MLHKKAINHCCFYPTTLIMANHFEDFQVTEEPENSPLLETILGSGEVGIPVDTHKERLVFSIYLPHYEPKEKINMIPNRLLSMLAYLATLKMYIMCTRYEGQCPKSSCSGHRPRNRWVNSTCRCKKPRTDVQIGVSGKKNIQDQNMAAAAGRELGEEIGVILRSGDISKAICVANTTTSRNLTCYFMPVSECRPVTGEEATTTVAPNQKDDDTTKKTWNFVFGSYTEIEAIMKRVTHVLPSNDRCASIVSIPAVQAYTAVRYIMGATGEAPSQPFSPDILKELIQEYKLGLESIAEPMKFQVEKALHIIAKAKASTENQKGFTLEMPIMPPIDSALVSAISLSIEMAPLVSAST